jgi:opacity protein-like surface antigen
MSAHRLVRPLIAALAGALVVVHAADARAQGFVSPLVGYDFGGDSLCSDIDDCEEKNLNAGIAFGTMGNVLGFELEAAYARHFFGEAPGFSSSVLTVMGNLMVIPNFGPVRPYGLVGLGLIKTNVELEPSSITSGDNNHFGWDIGGGLMIFFSDHVGIRGDLRYFHAFEDLEILGVTVGERKLDFGRVAGAVVFRF